MNGRAQQSKTTETVVAIYHGLSFIISSFNLDEDHPKRFGGSSMGLLHQSGSVHDSDQGFRRSIS